MQVNHYEVVAASRIGAASAMRPVSRILSAIVSVSTFVNTVAFMARRSVELHSRQWWVQPWPPCLGS